MNNRPPTNPVESYVHQDMYDTVAGLETCCRPTRNLEAAFVMIVGVDFATAARRRPNSVDSGVP